MKSGISHEVREPGHPGHWGSRGMYGAGRTRGIRSTPGRRQRRRASGDPCHHPHVCLQFGSHSETRVAHCGPSCVRTRAWI